MNFWLNLNPNNLISLQKYTMNWADYNQSIYFYYIFAKSDLAKSIHPFNIHFRLQSIELFIVPFDSQFSPISPHILLWPLTKRIGMLKEGGNSLMNEWNGIVAFPRFHPSFVEHFNISIDHWLFCLCKSNGKMISSKRWKFASIIGRNKQFIHHNI